MARSRAKEMPQRQSPRVSVPLRTSSSDSDPTHHRPINGRTSPKVGDRRSPRGGPPSDPLSQKKLGTRIAGLENQLGQAQEELKILKEQLSSAEAAKKEAQSQLEKKKKSTKPKDDDFEETQSQLEKKKKSTNPKHDDFSSHETDVYEVMVEKINTEKLEPEPEPPQIEEKPTIEDMAIKDNEISTLKEVIIEKEKKLQEFNKENLSLKSQLSDAALEVSTAEAKKAQINLKLIQVGQELELSQCDVATLKEKLVAVEGAKEELENEMKKLRVQTEQWRKAADAAAMVLAGVGEMNGRRISETCGSIDKHLGGVYDLRADGYAGFNNDFDDGFGGEKRKSSGIKMFGDLWKKKGHK